MKKCLHSSCSNTENTPNVKFHEVLASNIGNEPSKVAGTKNASNEKRTVVMPDESSADDGSRGKSAGTPKKPKKNRHCCAAGCDVSLLTHPDVGLFKFYPSQKRYEKWCLVADLAIRETHLAFCLCARHFQSSCFIDDERRNLKDSSNPMYPTAPLNSTTGNYCPYNKEPIIETAPLRKCSVQPEVIVAGGKSSRASQALQSERISAKVARSTNLPDIKKCSHFKCHNNSWDHPKSVFFEFPSFGDPRFESWSKAAGFGRIIHGRIHRMSSKNWLCSDHFHCSQFENESTLIATALPLSDDPALQQLNDGDSVIIRRSQIIANLKCDALGCPSSHINQPSTKFFSIEPRGQYSGKLDELIGQIGGVTGREKNIITICEYHFPGKAFVHSEFRLRLSRYKDYRLFPYGPLNPATGDYCPVGQEELSVLHHEKPVIVCYVKGCSSMKSLYRFPHYDDEAFEIWCERIGVNMNHYTKQYVIKNLCVCDLHFEESCKVTNPATSTVWLKYGALPTLNLPSNAVTPKRYTCMLVRDNVLPYGEELARSLLVQMATKDPIKRVHPRVTKASDDGVQPAKMPKYGIAKLPPDKTGGTVTHWGPSSFGVKKRGPRKKFEPDENMPSTTIKQFLDEFVGDMSPLCSPPLSPDPSDDPLVKTRDRSVQTDSPPEPTPAVEPKKIKKALEKLQELSSIDVGNEVDVPIILENNPQDKSGMNQVAKENALETALMGLFNVCKAGQDNAFSGLSDPSTIPDSGDDDGHGHQYSTHNTVNVIRSAAQLCEFNNQKILQLEQLMEQDEKDLSALEETLVKNLNAVICITGVNFIVKCFDRVLKDAINRQKANSVTPSVYKGKKLAESQVTFYNSNQAYSPETKQMSQALLAFSGKGYQLMRQIADLPSPHHVRLWSLYADGRPGFSDQAFKILRQHHLQWKKTKLCSLCVMDVALQKETSWDGQRTFGYVDLGYGSIRNDCIREASKAVVFYVKSVTENKALPVGYCLADDLTPQVRANLILQYVSFLDSVGWRCISLVCDYSSITYETFCELGAFTNEKDPGWFFHPLGKGVRVMCFTEVFQNIRALYDLWAEEKIFRPYAKAELGIDWDHITDGETFLNAPPSSLRTPAMVKFLSELNSLKLQAQNDLFSTIKCNAVMLTVLRDLGVKKFAATTQTIKYLESLAAVADLFSATHPFDIPDKRPMNVNNYSKTVTRLSSLSTYLGALCFRGGGKIMATNRKMPIALLAMNLCSLKNLAKRLFYGEKSKSVELYSKSLSLKDLSAAIATMCGGTERLVTPSNFRDGFKKFLDGYTWTPSEKLTCGRVDKSITEVSVGFSNAYFFEYSPLASVSESAMEFLTENVIETWLENVKCLECSQLIQKGILTSREYNFNGNVVRDIHKMIRTAETCLAKYTEISCNVCDAWFNKLSNEILNSLTSVRGFKLCNHLFASNEFGEISHFTAMIKDMLWIFLQLRLCFLNREERIKIQAPREHSMKFNLGRSWT